MLKCADLMSDTRPETRTSLPMTIFNLLRCSDSLSFYCIFNFLAGSSTAVRCYVSDNGKSVLVRSAVSQRVLRRQSDAVRFVFR